LVSPVTGSAVEVINPLAAVLAQAGARVYACQPFLSDNDVPGEEQHLGQTFINMDETNKLSIANAVRIVETKVRSHSPDTRTLSNIALTGKAYQLGP
jgi:hypothetical protein